MTAVQDRVDSVLDEALSTVQADPDRAGEVGVSLWRAWRADLTGGTEATGKRMAVEDHRPVPDSVIDAIAADPDMPRGWYAEHVLRGGYYPGVLSGAELRGEARNWGAWYHGMRERVESVAYRHDVYVRYVQPAGARVWHHDPRPGVVESSIA